MTATRDELREAFLAGLEAIDPKWRHSPREASSRFEMWYGTRVHMEVAKRLKAGLPLLVHDEIIGVDPGIPSKGAVAIDTETFAAWRCQTSGCPERPPTHAPTAPKCYTCDRPMTMVHRVPIDSISTILRNAMSSMGMQIPTMSEPREWIDARRQWSREMRQAAKPFSFVPGPQWGPSPLERKPGETDEQLRSRVIAQMSARMEKPHVRARDALLDHPLVLDAAITLSEDIRRESVVSVTISAVVPADDPKVRDEIRRLVSDNMPIGFDYRLITGHRKQLAAGDKSST